MRRLLPVLLVLLAAGPAAAQDMPLSQVLLPGETWRPVFKGLQSCGGMIADREGNVFVSDPKGSTIHRLDGSGKSHVFARTTSPVHGLAFGPDGRLIGCAPERRRIVAFGADGKEAAVLADGIAARDVALTRDGALYCTVPGEHAVYRVAPGGKKRRVGEGIDAPTGLVLWADGGTLVVGDAAGARLYAYRVEKDGSLDAREGYYTLRTRKGQGSGVAGLTIDDAGRLYAASRAGVQVFDPTGRLSGVLLRPRRAAVEAVALGGLARDRLFIVCGDTVYARKTQARGLGGK